MTQTSATKYRVVSLFCGAGGLDLGFENAGFPASIIMKPSNIHELVSQGKAIFSPTGLKTNLVAQINSGSLLG